MGADESNPISDSVDFGPKILPNKLNLTTFWSHIDASLDQRKRAGLYRELVVTQPISPTKILRNGVPATNFGSNDYLGLAWHPDILQTVADNDMADRRYGSGASPLVTGHSPKHHALVESIARLECSESAIVFSSGYAANLGTISAIASKQDVIFSDQLNHASLIDGCRLSGAKIVVYPHGDMEWLRQQARQLRGAYRFAFVVTDSVFSMDGDLAPLDEIHSLAEEFDLQCVVDEAHATGVYGQQGRGLLEHLKIQSERMIHVGTLSKAVGCVGGFVAGSRLLIDWLTNHSRAWIYSTATVLPNAAAAMKGLELASKMHVERIALRKRSAKLRTQLSSLGFQVGVGDSPIVPVYLHDAAVVVKYSQRLLELGHYVPAVRPPTVPDGKSLLRISLSVAHSENEIASLVDAMKSQL